MTGEEGGDKAFFTIFHKIWKALVKNNNLLTGDFDERIDGITIIELAIILSKSIKNIVISHL